MLRSRVAITGLVLLATSCSEQPIDPAPDPILPGALDVSVDSATLVTGEVVVPHATIVDENGAAMDLNTIEWTSSAPSVVSVDSLGRMTALSPGVAHITARAEPLEHVIEIRVAQILGITLIPDHDSLLVGERVRFQLVLDTDIPFNPRPTRVFWSTDSLGVAQVFAPGVVRARGVGDVVVQASIGGVSGTASIRVFDLGTPYSAVAAGSNGTCVLRDPGLLYCWGHHSYVGLPDTAMGGLVQYETRPLPHEPEGMLFDTVVGSGSAFCALASGQAYCWGWNTQGIFGPSHEPQLLYPVPVALEAGVQFQSISLGLAHACGLDGEGRAYCWGMNNAGQLGDGTLTGRPTPLPVAGDHRFSAIEAGGSHACGLTTDGVMLCWGDDSGGVIRAGGTPCAINAGGPCVLTPTAVPDVPSFVAIDTDGSFGSDMACGIAADGGLWCWGAQLGTPHRLDSHSYSTVELAEEHGCALTNEGAAFCFGESANYKLGNPAVHTFEAVPVPASTDARFGSLALGRIHTCGVTIDARSVYCWGSNGQGQLGIGTTTEAVRPERVSLP